MQNNGNITTAELFCGIGGFRIAADNLGISTVFANDMNPLSCAVYRENFGPAGLYEGDIHTLLETVPRHDLLTAGFPCQPFSAAGKKEGIRDPRGTLFQTIVDVIERTEPAHFILENVKRLLNMEQGKHFATILSALSDLGYWIEWRVLNAKNFGLAQNRERILICGRKLDRPLSVDRFSHVRLAEPYEFFGITSSHKRSISQAAHWKNIEQHGLKFPCWGMAHQGKFTGYALTDSTDWLPPVSLMEILEKEAPKEYDLTRQTLPRLSHNVIVNKLIHGVEIISNQGGGARMGYTIFGVNGLAPTLTASTSRHYERYKVGDIYRRLTPIEYARLQGFPDDHCGTARPYDQYGLLGNAVPPPMVEWTMRRWLASEDVWLASPEDLTQQQELFNA